MGAARLVFGVGATKAGTSWLHHALESHPECHFSPVKELHYFDALENGTMAREAERLRARRDWLKGQIEGAGARRLANLLRQLPSVERLLDLFERGEEDIEAYLAALTEGRGDRPVVGDITPAYGLLPEARLRQMAQLGDARMIYLLRDPVDRLWSHVRMMAVRRAGEGNAQEVPERASRILKRVLAGKEEQIEWRSDYAGALGRLRAAVPGDRLLVLFYEELFDPAGMARICEFLGIAPAPAPFGTKIHAGTSVPASAAEMAVMREHLSAQYDAVSRDMGRLPAAWTRHMSPPNGQDNLARV